jgi:hypothetical protein
MMMGVGVIVVLPPPFEGVGVIPPPGGVDVTVVRLVGGVETGQMPPGQHEFIIAWRPS